MPETMVRAPITLERTAFKERSARAMESLLRELRAVDAMLASADGGGPPVCVALLRAWYDVASLDAWLRDSEVVSFQDFVDAIERTDSIVSPHYAAALDDKQRSALVAAASLPAPPPADWPDRRALLCLRHTLAASAAGFAVRMQPRSGNRMRALTTVAIVALLVPCLWAFFRRPPVWRVVYFRTPRLVEPVAADLTADLGGNWGAGSPHRGVPIDGFSSRWETCLILDRPRHVEFELGSDDGARLRVDNATLINQWKSQSYAQQTASVDLRAGTHRVEVEHFDSGGDAELVLRARLDDEKALRPMPRSLLRAPGSGPNPCGS